MTINPIWPRPTSYIQMAYNIYLQIHFFSQERLRKETHLATIELNTAKLDLVTLNYFTFWKLAFVTLHSFEVLL